MTSLVGVMADDEDSQVASFLQYFLSTPSPTRAGTPVTHIMAANVGP